MTTRVDINSNMLNWAITRAGFAIDEFLQKNPTVEKWLTQERQPTVKQLESFSKKVNIPFGYLMLETPPKEQLPIPFFRSEKGAVNQVSLPIYDTILLLQNRQNWLTEYLKDNDFPTLPFVGKYDEKTDFQTIVADIRTTLKLEENWAATYKTWEDALNKLTETIENAGIVVTFNGVVGNNTHRPIEVKDCRGFVLVNEYVPFLFVNNRDAKAAQMFTLMHELAHIWLGESAGFDNPKMLPADDPVEQLCDKVAAELLVSENLLRTAWIEQQNIKKLARKFKVSPIVIGRRAMDLNLLSQSDFFKFYNNYIKDHYYKKSNQGSGGDFLATSKKRVSLRFAGFIHRALQQRQITHLDAYRLTGLKGETYQKFVDKNLLA